VVFIDIITWLPAHRVAGAKNDSKCNDEELSTINRHY